MTRYYFHFRNGDEFTPDPEGIELPNLAAAYESARHAAMEMAGATTLTRDALDARSFEIADEAGMVLAVSFGDFMEATGDDHSAHKTSIARWDNEGGAARPRKHAWAPARS
jgi:hypothetical protein